MTNTPHELAADFPEFTDQIRQLKETDPRFSKLMDDYHQINRQVHRAETFVEPMSEDSETELRKQRAVLKDQLYRMMRAEA